MCMFYKGVGYDYAFEFKVPIENSTNDRILNVVISNYREDSQDFSGLCLENELRVISEKKMIFEAFFEIVDSIVRITIEGEKSLIKTYGRLPQPLMRVQDRDFLDKFNEHKQSKRSLVYYEKLRMAFERPESIKGDDFREPKPDDLFDCHNMIYFNYLIQSNKVPIKEACVFRL